MKIHPNQPYYPVETTWDKNEVKAMQTSSTTFMETGITIRQKFAESAMQGILSNLDLSIGGSHIEWVTEYAAQMADALINELNKEKI